jgi:sugar-specific transcriptional regulator TrmB
MIIEKKFLSRLKDFGLNSYEAKIWAALLSRGVSTAGELSDISNVPRSRSYDVLESLEKKGFIIMKIGKPIKYIAVKPEEVLERVKKQITMDSEIQVEILDEMNGSEILTELSSLYNNGIEKIDPTELSASLKTRDHMYSHIDSMIKQSQSSVIIMATPDSVKILLESVKRNLEKAAARGVKVKIATVQNKDNEKILKEVASFSDVRNVDDIKARFVVVDEKEVAFAVMDDKKVQANYDAGIWVNTPFFANALVGMFSLIWQQKELKVKN